MKKYKIDCGSNLLRSSIKDKEKHLQICLEMDVESPIRTGFERFYFINNPLPEIDFRDIDTSCKFLGKRLRAPFIISPMTGGCEASKIINRNLAMAAQELGVVMSVGSQRLGLEDPSLSNTYQVREFAPNVPLLANLGAIYLNYGYGVEECAKAVDMIDADALVLYLNPLQKVFQKGEELNFRGLVKKIEYICKHLNVPVIVKEVGFGLSVQAAISLREAGVKMLDVAGAGGTSWVKINRFLEENFIESPTSLFDSWGIPTSDALIDVRRVVKDLPIIASGGVRNGLDMAKAIALGADYVGVALPLLSSAVISKDLVVEKIEGYLNELKKVMLCCGASNVSYFKKFICIKKSDFMGNSYDRKTS